MQDAKTAQQRLLYLDTCRGLAALRVMTWHFFVMFFSRYDPYFLKNPFRIFYYGDGDMLFFFIHSGFILSYSYANKLTLSDGASYLRFFIERVFRIFPLFLSLLAISFFIHEFFYSPTHHPHLTEHARELWSEDVTVTDVLQQAFLFMMPQSQSDRRLLPQDWTLSVEMIVGALLPFLIVSIQKNRWFFLIIFFLLWRLCNTYVFEFGLGVMLFSFREDIQQRWSATGRMHKVLLGFAALLFQTCFFQFPSLFSPENIVFSFSADRLIVDVGCVLGFCIIISSKKLQKLLSNQWLVWLGRICYSLYLWHLLLIILFAGTLYTFFLSITQAPYVAIAITFCLILFSTVMLSLFSFKFIEVPFNKLGKRISLRIKPFTFLNATRRRPEIKKQPQTPE